MTDEVAKEGLTVLAKGEDAIVDIVFVHGLRGHPKETWTYSNAGNGDGSNHRWVPQLRKSKTDSGGLYWPKELLKADFKDARILTFGYSSQLTGSFETATSDCGITDHANNLLHDLAYQRRDNPSRALVWIAHSLGGLVVKEALRLSWIGQPSLKHIYLSTHSIIFFGTPHRGSKYGQSLVQMCLLVADVFVTTNKTLPEELGLNSRFLSRLSQDFNALQDERQRLQRPLKIHCFIEGLALLPTNLLSSIGAPKGLVVEAHSATLGWPGETTNTLITKDHRQMCRFSSKEDPDYGRLKAKLLDYTEDIGKKVRDETNFLEDSQRKHWTECVESLRGPYVWERREEIQTAERHTFEWIFRQHATGFPEWLCGDSVLFWIEGKPGCGKSTLMKWLYRHERTYELLESKWVGAMTTASFFFDDQAKHPSQRSIKGLLCSLLHQLLRDIMELFPIVRHLYERVRVSGGWEVTELKEAFKLISKQTKVEGCCCLFVDALDEYQGDSREVVRMMKQLIEDFDGSCFKIKLCASGRPHELRDMFMDCPKFIMQAWTSQDIRILVSRRFQEVGKGHMAELQEKIEAKAKGSFVWIKLVLATLSTPLSDNESEGDLLERFEELPPDLDPFYQHLLEQIPMDIRPKIRHVLQVMFCGANRRLDISLVEISLASMLPEEGDIPYSVTVGRLHDDIKRCSDMKSRLERWLGGILELVDYKEGQWTPSEAIIAPLSIEEFHFTKSTLRFTHKTAKDFIIKSLNCDFFDPHLDIDNIRCGHIWLCRLYTFLARSPAGLPYFIPDGGTLEDHETFDIFKTSVIDNFCLHAREIEYLDYAAATQQIPVSHDTHDDEAGVITLGSMEAYINITKPPVQYPRHTSNIHRIRRMESFGKTMTTFIGDDWLNQYNMLWQLSSRPTAGLPSLLAFAIMNGLFLYAMDIIESESDLDIQAQDPPLLYWALDSPSIVHEVTLMELWPDELERCQVFIKYLLDHGADPNGTTWIPWVQRNSILRPLSQWRPSRSGISNLSMLHVCLGLIITHGFPSEVSLCLLQAMCLLLEAGAEVQPVYENYFLIRDDEPSTRSIIQYFCYPVGYNNFEQAFVPNFTPFADPVIGPLLCRTIKSLLTHGADPNAVDSAGTHVLTSIVTSSCPDDVVECALDAGAKIPVEMLTENGALQSERPVFQTAKYEKKKFYSEEAWTRVHNSTEGEDEEESSGDCDQLTDEELEEDRDIGKQNTGDLGLEGKTVQREFQVIFWAWILSLINILIPR